MSNFNTEKNTTADGVQLTTQNTEGELIESGDTKDGLVPEKASKRNLIISIVVFILIVTAIVITIVVLKKPEEVVEALDSIESAF